VPTLGGVQRGHDERVDLEEDERRSQDQREHERDRGRRREGLANPQRHRLVAFRRQRQVADVAVEVDRHPAEHRPGRRRGVLRGPLEHPDHATELNRDVPRVPGHGVRGLEWTVASANLRLGLVRERAVDHPQEPVVLPEAQSEGDPDDRERHDQPCPQLLEVVDGAQPVLVPDGTDDCSDRAQHRLAPARSATRATPPSLRVLAVRACTSGLRARISARAGRD
jgi:hypothetical protein